MHLKTLEVGIPGGWHDQCPYCGNHSVGITFGQLVSKVQVHYNNMGHHPVRNTVAEDVEERLCAALCPQDQAQYCQTGVRERTAVRWGEVAGFLTWLIGWFGSGRQLVPQPEADRRAQICAQCPYNIAVAGCAACRKGMMDMMRKNILNVEPTSVDVKLNACGVCGCDLKTLVHVPVNQLAARAGHDYSQVPWCWQNPKSPNYSEDQKV